MTSITTSNSTLNSNLSLDSTLTNEVEVLLAKSINIMFENSKRYALAQLSKTNADKEAQKYTLERLNKRIFEIKNSLIDEFIERFSDELFFDSWKSVAVIPTYIEDAVLPILIEDHLKSFGKEFFEKRMGYQYDDETKQWIKDYEKMINQLEKEVG